jgi:hypothetical protein
VWSHNGKELFYLSGSRGVVTGLMAVDADTSKGVVAETPLMLFTGSYSHTTPVRGYDVSPGGDRFFMTKLVIPVEPPITTMNLVVNWLDELKARVPAK